MMHFTTAQVERMHSWANTCFWSQGGLMEVEDAELFLQLKRLLGKPTDDAEDNELQRARELLGLPDPKT